MPTLILLGMNNLCRPTKFED